MKRYIYCMAIFAIMLFSCNKASEIKVQDTELEAQTSVANKQEATNSNDQFNTADTIGVATNTGDKSPKASLNNPDWDKKIIKTASLHLQLDDYKKFNIIIHNSLKQYGAYIAGEKQEETDYKIENTLIIKVPVAQFDDLVNSFSGEGIKIIEKNISSDDVTGQVVDIKARMQAKMAVREKYADLLKQAKNMNEILQVQNEINSIQEDIEAANSRVTYLQHASAYSTINLTYYHFINGSTPKDEKPDFFTKMSKAFSIGTSFVSNLVLFLISIWPLMLIGIGVLIYLKKIKLKKA